MTAPHLGAGQVIAGKYTIQSLLGFTSVVGTYYCGDPQGRPVVVKLFDPASALAAPEEGLADLRRILEGAPKFLNPGGWVVLETGTDQHARLAEISVAAGLVEGQGSPDLSGRPRFWKARRKSG